MSDNKEQNKEQNRIEMENPKKFRYMVNSREPLYLPPIRCKSCGHLLGEKWYKYTQELRKLTGGDFSTIPQRSVDINLIKENNKTAEGNIMDKLGIIKYCCRTVIITNPSNRTAIDYD